MFGALFRNDHSELIAVISKLIAVISILLCVYWLLSANFTPSLASGFASLKILQVYWQVYLRLFRSPKIRVVSIIGEESM